MAKALITNEGELIALFIGLSRSNEYPLNITHSKLGNRSLSQNALQHSIYGEISKYLISKGRSDCNAKWIKDMLKSKFLGWIEESFTDIVTGEKFTKEVMRKTSDLDSGEAYHYTTQIIDWAESIGCTIKIPANSVYMKLMDEQNG